MKLCKDCKHYENEWEQRGLVLPINPHYCNRKVTRNTKTCVVTGHVRVYKAGRTTCFNEREIPRSGYVDRCGEVGKYWESK